MTTPAPRLPTLPLLLPLALLLTACTTCEVTYKAVSKDIPCVLDPDRTAFVENPAMSNLISGQSRRFLSDQGGASGGGFSDEARFKGQMLSGMVVGYFRGYVADRLKARIAPAADRAPTCHLAISPQTFIADPADQFTVEMKATVIDTASGKALLSNKIRIQTSKANDKKVVDLYAARLVSELKKDRFF